MELSTRNSQPHRPISPLPEGRLTLPASRAGTAADGLEAISSLRAFVEERSELSSSLLLIFHTSRVLVLRTA